MKSSDQSNDDNCKCSHPPEVKLAHFQVRDYHYTIPVDVINLNVVKGSFFERCLSEEWIPEDRVVRIDRDGMLFRHIVHFLEFGILPVGTRGESFMDEDMLRELIVESDYYCLSKLTKECERLLTSPPALNTYHTYEGKLLTTAATPQDEPYMNWECVFQSEDRNHPVNTLEAFFSPFCVTDQVRNSFALSRPLFKSSTLDKLNISELLENAKPSSFGRGRDTVFDITVRNSFEIDAADLDSTTLTYLKREFNLKDLSYSMIFDIQPYKLVIYQEGGHFTEHVDSVRGENHVGTLVYFCNSEFTGGELEVSARDVTERFGGPHVWVALYGDCKHQVLPVTSGVRVTIIFDLYRAREWEAGRVDNAFEKKFLYNLDYTSEVYFHTEPPCEDANIKGGIDTILAGNERDLALCLSHRYPYNQIIGGPGFLKGGDRASYDFLIQYYEVELIAVMITSVRSCYYDEGDVGVVAGRYILDDLTEQCDPGRKASLIIATPLYGSIMKADDGSENVGNEAPNEEYTYLASAVLIRNPASQLKGRKC